MPPNIKFSFRTIPTPRPTREDHRLYSEYSDTNHGSVIFFKTPYLYFNCVCNSFIFFAPRFRFNFQPAVRLSIWAVVKTAPAYRGKNRWPDNTEAPAGSNADRIPSVRQFVFQPVLRGVLCKNRRLAHLSTNFRIVKVLQNASRFDDFIAGHPAKEFCG